MTELTGGVIPGMFQGHFDIKKSGYPILQVRCPIFHYIL